MVVFELLTEEPAPNTLDPLLGTYPNVPRDSPISHAISSSALDPRLHLAFGDTEDLSKPPLSPRPIFDPQDQRSQSKAYWAAALGEIREEEIRLVFTDGSGKDDHYVVGIHSTGLSYEFNQKKVVEALHTLREMQNAIWAELQHWKGSLTSRRRYKRHQRHGAPRHVICALPHYLICAIYNLMYVCTAFTRRLFSCIYSCSTSCFSLMSLNKRLQEYYSSSRGGCRMYTR